MSGKLVIFFDRDASFAEAERRILAEAAARTGTLNLSGLALSELPEALWELTHLRALYLGPPVDDEGKRVESDWLWISLAALPPQIAKLRELQRLAITSTMIADLRPIRGLTNLQSLDCRVTMVSDLAPIRGLTKLRSLVFWHTQVSDLAPIRGLSNLRFLSCNATRVTRLDPILDLPALEWIHAMKLVLDEFPTALLDRPALRSLFLHRSTIRGVPADVIPSEPGDNALPALRAHFADLAQGAVPWREAKLLVLGNGRLGKTQLCRRLRGEDFEESADSTHGIRVSTAPLPLADGAAARLHLWDFGGQDLYHGTHALFLKAASLFLVLWTPEGEREGISEHKGLKFRDHALPWWLSYIRATAGEGHPLLLVRGQMDRAESHHTRAPVPAEALEPFPYWEIGFSAVAAHGADALRAALGQALDRHLDSIGRPLIGKGRLALIDRILKLRNPDGTLPPDHRTLPRAEFDKWCQDTNLIRNPTEFLRFLTNAGIVFWREGLFEDRIILDFAWLVAGLYAPFDRAGCWQALKRAKGRFTRTDLAAHVWDAAGHSVEDQRLFLAMMRQCGMAFVHRTTKPWDPDRNDETEYIAPELLPERDHVALALESRWGDGAATMEATWTHALLHPGIVAGVIAWIGEQAGMDGLYWRGGAHAYDGTRKSHALVEAEAGPGPGGVLRLSVKGGDAAGLLTDLVEAIDRVNRRLGLSPEKTLPQGRAARAEHPTQPPADPKLHAAPPPPKNEDWYVSYKWGDDTDEGKQRTAIVERLMAEASKQKVRILYDKNDLRYNESITGFMEKLADGQRIFLLLSDKYLRLPFCTYELAEIWRISQQNPELLRKRIRVYLLDCAKGIRTLPGRRMYRDHWKAEVQQGEKDLEGIPVSELLELDRKRQERMEYFATNALKILGTLADTLTPGTWEEFVEHGFTDAPPQ